MRYLERSSAYDVRSTPDACVVITSCRQHVGLLYRTTDPPSSGHMVLDLLLSERVRSEDFDSLRYVVIASPDFGDGQDQPKQATVAALCRRISKLYAQDRFPYGFSSPKGFLDAGGYRVEGDENYGLTCAAFVLAIFDAADARLIDYESWPLPLEHDIDFQEWASACIQKRTPDPKEAVKRAKGIGNRRFTPMQVTAAAAANYVPVQHNDIKPLEQEVESLLESKS
jgi:hypothetical protein